MDTEVVMGVQEAAEYLRVSRFKMARLIRDREVPTFTTPLDRRRKLVRRSDLDALKTRIVPEEGPAYTQTAA